MTKQNRAEIKALKRNRKLVQRGWYKFLAEHNRSAATLRRTHHRTLQGVGKEVARIDKRIAILEGRLS